MISPGNKMTGKFGEKAIRDEQLFFLEPNTAWELQYKERTSEGLASYLKEEFLATLTTYLSFDPSSLFREKFVEERRAKTAEIMRHAFLVQEWAVETDHVQYRYWDGGRGESAMFLFKELKKLLSPERIALANQYDWSFWESQEPLTAKSWQEMRSEIVEETKNHGRAETNEEA